MDCPKCGKKDIKIQKIGDVTTVKYGKSKRWKSVDCGHTFYLRKDGANDNGK